MRIELPMSPGLIAVGLLVLVAAGTWPLLPAVTGMALVMLGATMATVERFRGTPALAPIVVGHVAIYGSLYALFVGAVLNTTTSTSAGVGWSLAIDLAMSIVPLAATVRLVFDALRATRTAE